MYTTINIHGPYEYAPKRYYHDDTGNAYVSLKITAQDTTLWLYFDTRDQCAALAQAALAAKDLLNKSQEPPPAACRAEHPTRDYLRCTLPEGHPGGHTAEGSEDAAGVPVTWPREPEEEPGR